MLGGFSVTVLPEELLPFGSQYVTETVEPAADYAIFMPYKIPDAYRVPPSSLNFLNSQLFF